MVRAIDVIAVAEGQVGVVERPTNRTPYGAWYGLDSQPWCAMFLSWCHGRIGALDLIDFSTSKGYAYTPTGAAGFQREGRWGSQPQVGAHVFFRFSGPRIHHVGLVVGHGAGYLETIEGNTSRGTAGSQRDGGGVWRRRRSSGIVGYGYPAYDGTPGEVPPITLPPGDDWRSHPVLRQGTSGPMVRHLQELLLRAAHDLSQEGGADGVFGPGTARELVAYQAHRGLAADGICGPRTWERLHRGG